MVSEDDEADIIRDYQLFYLGRQAGATEEENDEQQQRVPKPPSSNSTSPALQGRRANPGARLRQRRLNSGVVLRPASGGPRHHHRAPMPAIKKVRNTRDVPKSPATFAAEGLLAVEPFQFMANDKGFGKKSGAKAECRDPTTPASTPLRRRT